MLHMTEFIQSLFRVVNGLYFYSCLGYVTVQLIHPRSNVKRTAVSICNLMNLSYLTN